MTEIPRVPGRTYQVNRDPERFLIEKRAEALSLLGYPLFWKTIRLCMLSRGSIKPGRQLGQRKLVVLRSTLQLRNEVRGT